MLKHTSEPGAFTISESTLTHHMKYIGRTGGLASADSTLATIFGGSASAYDRTHTESLVASIIAIAEDYTGGKVCLHGMTLPYKNQEEAHDGCIEFRVAKTGLPDIAFSIEFGGKERTRLGFGEIDLDALRKAAEHGDAVNHMASVFNFDELWLFANMLVKKLTISHISIAFGGLGGL